MNKLINELEKEHQEITDILHELQKTGVSSANGMKMLIQSKTALLSHLAKEDKHLYPPLQDKAKTDLSLKITLDTFGAEMGKISKSALDFYQEYSDINNINKIDFIKDTTKLIVTLKGRIMKEEIAIYKAYEKLKLD